MSLEGRPGRLVQLARRGEEPGWQLDRGWLRSPRGAEARVPTTTALLGELDEGVLMADEQHLYLFREGTLTAWDLGHRIALVEGAGGPILAIADAGWFTLAWVPGEDRFVRGRRIQEVTDPRELRKRVSSSQTPLLANDALLVLRAHPDNRVFRREALEAGPVALPGLVVALDEDRVLIEQRSLYLWQIGEGGAELVWEAGRGSSPDGRFKAERAGERVLLTDQRSPDVVHVLDDQGPYRDFFLSEELVVTRTRDSLKAWNSESRSPVPMPALLLSKSTEGPPRLETQRGEVLLGALSEGGWFVATSEQLFGEDPAGDLIELSPGGTARLAISGRPLVTEVEWRAPEIVEARAPGSCAHLRGSGLLGGLGLLGLLLSFRRRPARSRDTSSSRARAR